MTDEREHKPGEGLVIDCLYAWVSSGEEGEGVLGHYIPELGNTPLVGADRARIESMRPYALNVAKLTGKAVYLKRFSKKETLEVMNPDGTKEVRS